jgi:hypothetical protein
VVGNRGSPLSLKKVDILLGDFWSILDGVVLRVDEED